MNYIHLALFIAVAICLLIISWRPAQKEGFNDGEGLVFKAEHCPLISSQIKGYKESVARARADNQFSTMANYNNLIESLEAQAKKIGCTGNETASSVPLALPSSMTSAEIEDAKTSAQVIDLTTVPSVVSVS